MAEFCYFKGIVAALEINGKQAQGIAIDLIRER
jgi:hypothetical protein